MRDGWVVVGRLYFPRHGRNEIVKSALSLLFLALIAEGMVVMMFNAATGWAVLGLAMLAWFFLVPRPWSALRDD